MSPSFARIAPTYDTLRPLSAGDRAGLEAMLREAAVGAEDLVVEVGCGTGRLTLPLAGLTSARVMGVDAEARMLEVAQAKDVAGRVEWVRGSAYRLPVADGTARLVVMAMVIHLLRQRTPACGVGISRPWRCCRPSSTGWVCSGSRSCWRRTGRSRCRSVRSGQSSRHKSVSVGASAPNWKKKRSPGGSSSVIRLVAAARFEL